mmetsp:Transcript_29196/g.57255  ORF Transcript_29196/g.57255 Transcript_29196/m.57255 type:complete len:194 (-) Transcript_29196:98-679(-)
MFHFTIIQPRDISRIPITTQRREGGGWKSSALYCRTHVCIWFILRAQHWKQLDCWLWCMDEYIPPFPLGSPCLAAPEACGASESSSSSPSGSRALQRLECLCVGTASLPFSSAVTVTSVSSVAFLETDAVLPFGIPAEGAEGGPSVCTTCRPARTTRACAWEALSDSAGRRCDGPALRSSSGGSADIMTVFGV